MDRPEESRKATIVGWHAHRNAGDDAMLQTIAWFLHRYGDVDRIALMACKRTMPALHDASVKAVPVLTCGDGKLSRRLLHPFLRRRAARNSDIIVFGGGSIFHSEQSIQWKIDMLEEARRRRKPICALAMGVSLGPFKSSRAEALCDRFVSGLDGIMVRDRQSFDVAARARLRRPALLSHDLAHALPVVTSRAARQGTANGRRLGISVTRHPAGEAATTGIIRSVSGALRQLAERKVIDEVAIFEFCDDPQFGDGDLAERLRQELAGAGVRVIGEPYRPDPFDLMEAVAQCDGFMGMRLHSQIFAFAAGVPLLVLPYSEKCHEFMRMVGLPASAAIAFDADEAHYRQAVETLFSDPRAPSDRAASVRASLMADLETLGSLLKPAS